MKSAEEDFARAARHLSAARFLAGGGFADIAAREAYMAAFHAAQAYLTVISGRVPKTHRGLIAEFGRLARSDPAMSPTLLQVLPKGFVEKSAADYGGPTHPDAETAIAAAENMLQAVEASTGRFSRLTPDELQTIFAASWSLASSGQWTAANPARGQCNVTALIADEVFGGDLLRTMTSGGWHYYNRVDGVRLDFTASQFPEPLEYGDVPALRREALAGTTEAHYRALRDAVVHRIMHG